MRRATPPSLWFKDAIVYQTHVRAFSDSNADGIGDFRGLTARLDYLADLGVTAIWLLPFYPSPLRDDGYDIADYTGVHHTYGTLRDFKAFLRAAHERDLRVITELIINHTSDRHPWFQRARRARPGTPERDFYVWSDTPDRYPEARIIFKDFESSNWAWDRVAGAYYWHRFYTHQPDLNFDSPAVRRAVARVVDFWLDLGVDGLRLDAVPYLFEREGTTCENLEETHAFLRDLRRHVDANFADRMLLAEANQWPEDAAAYFGNGDECHMAFHFPLMPRMFMAIRMEDRFPVIDILEQTPSIPETAQWALFLRNHDELTLEMVTDEERDYMYRAYATDPQARINLGIRRRLAPLIGNDRRTMELMKALLFSMPGTPVVYYGDEIGMGDNIYLGDRNGVRTPMQWSGDRNAGFSRANPQRLFLPVIIDPEYHYEAINVEAQQANPHSLLWWMKRVIALRHRSRALSRGTLEFLFPENRKVLAFVRTYEDERVLVVANLSRLAQHVEIDLSRFAGMVPVEVFGGTEFPQIGELPYLITLGPHSFYWLSLTAPRVEVPLPAEESLPSLGAERVTDVVPMGSSAGATRDDWLFMLVAVEYPDGDPETYVVPLAFRAGDDIPWSAIARVHSDDGDGVLYDAFDDPAFGAALLASIGARRRFRGPTGRLVAQPTRAFRAMRGADDLTPAPVTAEQSNTSLVYGERLVLKLIRRTEPGVNPDLEIGRFLTERTTFRDFPPVGGSLEFENGAGTPMTVGVLQGFVPNEGDAWRYTLEELGRFIERALALGPEAEAPIPSGKTLIDLADAEPPRVVVDTIAGYLESARLLGLRTAELHRALASDTEDPAFAPEPLGALYQRSVYQTMRATARRAFQLARSRVREIPDLEEVLAYEDEALARFRRLLARKVDAQRIRCHGDFHLGQVLWTGRDFVIIDFEGEPARALSERRIKRSPLTDVAGMLRSFHYATFTALLGQTGGGVVRPEDRAAAEPWMLAWYLWTSAAFLRAYWEASGEGAWLPRTREDLEVLLDTFMLEKALYELRYEINNRPDWVPVPIRGVVQLLEGED